MPPPVKPTEFPVPSLPPPETGVSQGILGTRFVTHETSLVATHSSPCWRTIAAYTTLIGYVIIAASAIVLVALFSPSTLPIVLIAASAASPIPIFTFDFLLPKDPKELKDFVASKLLELEITDIDKISPEHRNFIQQTQKDLKELSHFADACLSSASDKPPYPQPTLNNLRKGLMKLKKSTEKPQIVALIAPSLELVNEMLVLPLQKSPEILVKFNKKRTALSDSLNTLFNFLQKDENQINSNPHFLEILDRATSLDLSTKEALSQIPNLNKHRLARALYHHEKSLNASQEAKNLNDELKEAQETLTNIKLQIAIETRDQTPTPTGEELKKLIRNKFIELRRSPEHLLNLYEAKTKALEKRLVKVQYDEALHLVQAAIELIYVFHPDFSLYPHNIFTPISPLPQTTEAMKNFDLFEFGNQQGLNYTTISGYRDDLSLFAGQIYKALSTS